MSDLKPCPFHENEVYPFWEVEQESNGQWFAWLICSDSGCAVSKLGVSDVDDEDPKASAMKMAIEQWNTRYERTCIIKSSRYDDLSEEWEYELSCGDYYFGNSRVPKYCPECGARVINE